MSPRFVPVDENGKPAIGGPDWASTRTQEHREFISSTCRECIIEVNGWAKRDVNEPVLFVTLLSGHVDAFNRSWRGRRRAIWRSIRGRWAGACIETNTREELDDLIEALIHARGIVFPEDAP